MFLPQHGLISDLKKRLNSSVEFETNNGLSLSHFMPPIFLLNGHVHLVFTAPSPFILSTGFTVWGQKASKCLSISLCKAEGTNRKIFWITRLRGLLAAFLSFAWVCGWFHGKLCEKDEHCCNHSGPLYVWSYTETQSLTHWVYTYAL